MGQRHLIRPATGLADPPDPLTEARVFAALAAVRELPERLDTADTELRADVYRSLGITLAYRRDDGAEYVRVEAAFRGLDLERVGGGI